MNDPLVARLRCIADRLEVSESLAWDVHDSLTYNHGDGRRYITTRVTITIPADTTIYGVGPLEG